MHDNVYICKNEELILSQELLCVTILGTNFHLTKKYTTSYIVIIDIRWLLVDVNVVACIKPPSILMTSSTVTTMIIIIIIWSAELHPIQCMRCKIISTYSSKPFNK